MAAHGYRPRVHGIPRPRSEGCRRWLLAVTDIERADNEGWVREFIERPLTSRVVEALLTA